MGINPSGNRSPDDVWVRGAQGDSSSTQGTGATNSNLGAHNVTTSTSQPQVASKAKQLWQTVREFFLGKKSPDSSQGASGPAMQSPSGPTIRPTRPAPPPPTTGGANAKRPATHGKGRAPQPPTAGSSSGSEQPTAMSSEVAKLVSELKDAVHSHAESQKVLKKVSQELQTKWTDWENNRGPDYLLHGYRVIARALQQTYTEQSMLIEGTLSTGPVPQAVTVAKDAVTQTVRGAIKNLENPKPGNDPDGVLMQVVISLGIEGPTLDPGESIQNFLETRVSDFGGDDSDIDYTSDIARLGSALDRVRENHPNEMPRIWIALARELGAAVHSHATSVRIANAGKNHTRDVVRMANESSRLLQGMKVLSVGAWANTMTVLIGDLFE
ncbi:YwbM [Chlamydia pneumoniae TW-183]|uniref:YwbM n=2 Tax=Chlamydia pneumoniae TaxID=83558 RepID=A0A0F7XTU7_CHLPN|nr:hypothetical protein [Chlamydia pneumoniae]AAP98633.1 YwbM [Chlamydia pneumoniae TW-183]CRI51850.1 YwbM [Chlamydia pneumoniae]